MAPSGGSRSPRTPGPNYDPPTPPPVLLADQRHASVPSTQHAGHRRRTRPKHGRPRWPVRGVALKVGGPSPLGHPGQSVGALSGLRRESRAGNNRATSPPARHSWVCRALSPCGEPALAGNRRGPTLPWANFDPLLANRAARRARAAWTAGLRSPLGLAWPAPVGACGSYVARAPAPDRSARKRPDLVYASLDCVGQRVERFADVDGLAHELAVPDLGSRSR